MFVFSVKDDVQEVWKYGEIKGKERGKKNE
jgi:hypothetical protein